MASANQTEPDYSALAQKAGARVGLFGCSGAVAVLLCLVATVTALQSPISSADPLIIIFGAAAGLLIWQAIEKNRVKKQYEPLAAKQKAEAKARAAKSKARVVVNETIYAEPDAFLGMPYEDRPKHVWVAGMPGFGKSNFLLYMVLYDMMLGKGVTVIDPGGDLVHDIIKSLPTNRNDDTILLESANPVPLDFMACSDDGERELLVSDLMRTFRRLSEMSGGQWGVRMEAILRDTLYTLLNADGTSFTDIYYFLTSKRRRAEILSQGSVPGDLRERWETRFPHDDAIEPIISRMTPIIRTKSLHTIFGTPNAALNIGQAMDEGKTILVDLGGASESAVLYGSMLVSKYQQAAFRRAKSRGERVPHYLFVDEFQNFRSSEFETIISQGRKFQLCLTVANQWVSQLPAEVRSGVMATGTWFLFRLSPEDLPTFKGHMPPIGMSNVTGYYDEKGQLHGEGVPIPFDVATLGSLAVGTAICKSVDGKGSIVLVPAPPPDPKSLDPELYAEEHLRPYEERLAHVRMRTLEQYGPEACKAAAKPHTEGNGKPDPPTPKPEPGPDTGKGKPKKPKREGPRVQPPL